MPAAGMIAADCNGRDFGTPRDGSLLTTVAEFGIGANAGDG
jgi:hypothetical protein